MAGDIPELISRWSGTESFITIADNDFAEILPSDPERLCFGIGSSNLNTAIRLCQSVNGLADRGFSITGPGQLWFYWQKHGSVVNFAWQVSNFSGNPVVIAVYNVTRTNIS